MRYNGHWVVGENGCVREAMLLNYNDGTTEIQCIVYNQVRKFIVMYILFHDGVDNFAFFIYFVRELITESVFVPLSPLPFRTEKTEQ